jgi:hypothetical protein
MLISTLAAGLAFFSVPSEQSAYEAQLEATIGQSYTAAIEMLGLPVQRDLRDGGGEIWMFRNLAHGGALPVGDLGNRSGTFRVYRVRYGDPTVTAERPEPYRGPPAETISVCTTRIALDADGSVAGYAVQGTCHPR